MAHVCAYYTAGTLQVQNLADLSKMVFGGFKILRILCGRLLMCIILASLMELFRVAIELILVTKLVIIVLHHLLCSGLIPTWQATHSIPPLEMSSSIYYRLQLKFHNDSFSASIYFPSILLTYQLCALPIQHQCSSQMTLPSRYVIGSSVHVISTHYHQP